MPDSESFRTPAAVELSLLNVSTEFGDDLEGVSLGAGTTIYDLNGEELFERVPIEGRAGVPAFADIARNPAMGAILMGVSRGIRWDEAALLQQAREAAGVRKAQREADSVRFVAYSFPKVAVQFLADGKEIALLELWTWQPVPRRRRSKEDGPSNFERWSFLDENPVDDLAKRRARFRARVRELEPIGDRLTDVVMTIDRARLLDRLGISLNDLLFDTRELHFTTRNGDHHPCLELRGQETNVWCVGASVQMVLDFYRYQYGQVRLAQELGLGTVSNPNGLPHSRDNDVVTTLEKLSNQSLDATLTQNPTWNLFRDEIRANRPVISFVPGHSRVVAGYTRSTFMTLINLTPFRGLLVYDPWPPNAGVITRWENWATHSYTQGFTSHVTLV
ncbi:MAG TPA: C39 family peptidase [Candidatus Limnocylindrales bacterium]|nr:C39 family peptidase [Candidatus Limnocylindrales bacterium]